VAVAEVRSVPITQQLHQYRRQLDVYVVTQDIQMRAPFEKGKSIKMSNGEWIAPTMSALDCD